MPTCISQVLRYGPCVCVTRGSIHTVLLATHIQNISAFTLHKQGVTALWLVLIVPTKKGMARLS